MPNPTQIALIAADGNAPEAVERLRDEPDFDVTTFDSAPRDIDRFDVVVLDDDLDDGLIETICRGFKGVVLLLADSYSPETLARTIELDIDAFVQKSVRSSEIVRIIRQELKREPTKGPGSHDAAKPIVGESEPMQDLMRILAKVAPSELPVLIAGESGTGKELVARAIHRLSPRRHGPFQAVNCGALPENLIESELFGHEKGAFTGADSRRKGVFEASESGTLFLDEIGELPLHMQAKLLRVLEGNELTRVGGTEPIEVDTRLLFATNRDLEAEAKAGRFREDLLYRIDVVRIDVPPLRQRKSDIETLWEHFVREAAEKEGRSYLGTRPDVIRMLMRYEWPGNVRELRNLAQQAVIRRSSGKITPRLVEPRLRDVDRSEPASGRASQKFVPRTLEEIERDAIIETFRHFDNVKTAAEVLGISERKMYYRLKEYREKGLLDEGGGEYVVVAVEDSVTFSRISECLDPEAEVEWVKSGPKFLESIYDRKPDCAIVAADLPILDGVNLLELGHEQGWEIPTIFVGKVDTATREYVEALGAVAVVEDVSDTKTFRWIVETATSE